MIGRPPICGADEKRRPAWGTGGAGAVCFTLGEIRSNEETGALGQKLLCFRDRLVATARAMLRSD
jgi:hypothetical protein